MEMRKNLRFVVAGIFTILLVTACFALFNIVKADEEATEVATEAPVVEYPPLNEPDIDTSGVVTGGVYIVDGPAVSAPDYSPVQDNNTGATGWIPANVTRPENYVNGGSQIWSPYNYGNSYGYDYGYDANYYAGTDTTATVTEATTAAEPETTVTPASDAKRTLDEKKAAITKPSEQKDVKIPETGTVEKNNPTLLFVIVLVLLGGIITTSILARKNASKK